MPPRSLMIFTVCLPATPSSGCCGSTTIFWAVWRLSGPGWSSETRNHVLSTIRGKIWRATVRGLILLGISWGCWSTIWSHEGNSFTMAPCSVSILILTQIHSGAAAPGWHILRWVEDSDWSSVAVGTLWELPENEREWVNWHKVWCPCIRRLPYFWLTTPKVWLLWLGLHCQCWTGCQTSSTVDLR